MALSEAQIRKKYDKACRERDAIAKKLLSKTQWAVYDPVKQYMTPSGKKDGPMLIARFASEHHAVLFQEWYFSQIKKLRPIYVTWEGR